MAKPSQDSPRTLIVTEFWGLGDLALAIPFLNCASVSLTVSLVAKPHAAPLLKRFAPKVELIPFVAPWTSFRGKYHLLAWPWKAGGGMIRSLRHRSFGLGASARRDPRDHAFLALAGARRRFGFPCRGSSILLTDRVPRPSSAHRAAYWESLASALGFTVTAASQLPRPNRRILIHAGAGQPTRRWPIDRFRRLASDLDRQGWTTEVIDDSFEGVERLVDRIAQADRFIGNDSGPGHIAALLGVPTFTIFGPQIPEVFAPRHPKAAWIGGAPCPYKPCRDYCHYSEPHCLYEVDYDTAQKRIVSWLST